MAFNAAEGTAIGGAAAGIGIAAAQGFANPISDVTAVASLVGMGMSLFGTNKAAEAASHIAGDQQGILTQDQNISDQRQTQAHLEASRQRMQDIRNAQVAAATGLSRGVNQGAQFGSGVAGGYGQIQGQLNTGLLGINQNLEIADNIFGYEKTINSYKSDIAQWGGQESQGQGLAALGGAVAGSADKVGKGLGSLFAQGFSGFGNSGEVGKTA